jgi:hypothetical protein
MDAARLKALPGAAASAGSVDIRAVISLRDDVTPMFGTLSPLGSRIMALLADGKPWRGKHIIERTANGLKPSTVRDQLGVLLGKGRISKPRLGVWILAGMPDPPISAIPPLRTELADSPKDRKVLARLSQPTAALPLVGELGVSRQRVDQILKKLLERGKVKRFPEPGAGHQWLWIRSDIDAANFLLNHVPKLPEGCKKTLNCLEPDAFHWVGHIAHAAGRTLATTRRQTCQMETLGLVATIRLGQKVYVSITPRGLDHPARSGLGPKAAISDLSKSFGGTRVAILETLAVLGEAKTIEITAAMVGIDRPGTDMMSGQYVARLLATEFAEPCPGDPHVRSSYRLTEAGRFAAALIARHRPPPGKAQVEERIAAFWAQRTSRLREVGLRRNPRGDSMAGSPAQQAILDILAEGPRSTRALQEIMGVRLRNKRSIHLMLAILERRGAVKKIGKEGRSGVWYLRSNNGDASAGPAVQTVKAG